VTNRNLTRFWHATALVTAVYAGWAGLIGLHFGGLSGLIFFCVAVPLTAAWFFHIFNKEQ
jgi:hypothetical protein